MSSSVLILHIMQAVVIKINLKLMSSELNMCLRKESSLRQRLPVVKS